MNSIVFNLINHGISQGHLKVKGIFVDVLSTNGWRAFNLKTF